MIKTPTVLVLGAGASMPFNFPSGSQLAEYLSWFGDINDLISAGYNQSEIVEFREELKRSGKGSVDAFLEHRTEFIDVGKAAIAYRLIREEDPNVILRFSDNWYRYIFSRIDAPLDQFPQNKLAIITFNYDRSLEQFLFESLKHSYNGSDDRVADALSKIPIIHVHGQMGLLSWQTSGFGVTTRREYGNSVNPDLIRCAAAGIRIVHEVKDMAPFEQAFQYLASAERIVFLGFGYNATNLSRLQFPKVLSLGKHGKLSGTFYGLTSAQTRHIQQTLFNDAIAAGGNGEGALSFLTSSVSFQAD